MKSINIEFEDIIGRYLNINVDGFENLLGNDAEYNANKIIDILKGKSNDFSKAVCLNAAAGLIVSEKYKNFNIRY